MRLCSPCCAAPAGCPRSRRLGHAWTASACACSAPWLRARRPAPPRRSEPSTPEPAMPVLTEPNAEPIPGYRLLEPLGKGGFGEVWKCEAPGGLFKAIKFVAGSTDLDGQGSAADEEWQAVERIKA